MSDQPIDDRQDGRRTSLYLVRRADALLGALRFFTVSVGDTSRRRLQFLAQSDFWEWEIDNLIYSFATLPERRETWRSPNATVEKLGRLGIAIDAKLLRKASWRSNESGRAGRWALRTSGERVAPVALLREVIDAWNLAVTLVEEQFIAPMRENAAKWNMQTRKDLNSLRKSMPAMEDLDDED